MIYYVLKYIILPFYWLFRMPKVVGYENTRAIRRGKAVIICNHRSNSDALLLALTMPRFIHFMGKAELFKNRIAGAVLNGLLVFPVDRSSMDMKAMKQALEVLEKGKVFGIFPEGKRCVTDDIDEFEKGAAFFAIKTNAPILPLYIPKDNFRLFKRPRLYVGKAIMPEEYNNIPGSKSAAVRKLSDMFEERVNELRVIAGD